ncbi:hypothetical protein A6U92_25745 [Agrobacterium rubi]|nr:hypothetical protein A6U92_25745 [Agrobacterium rubi]
MDVRAINDGIRTALQAQGLLAKDNGQGIGDDDASKVKVAADSAAQTHREIVYQTVNGKRSFARGDRILLLENNRDLGVKNGMLGTVEAVEPNAIHLRLDGAASGQNNARVLSLPVKDYQSFDHGYATTIHKSQGATVDRAFVMASSTMDRHLTYVAMTRHRHQATLYAGRDDLTDMKEMVASMSRSGAKETTLDYIDVFAERRGLTLQTSPRIDLANPLVPMQTSASRATPIAREEQDRPLQRQHAVEAPSGLMRAGNPVDPALHAEPAKVLSQTSNITPNQSREYDTPAPLIPAVRFYDRSVEDIAHEKALPNLVRALEDVRSVGRQVYIDPDRAVATLTCAITEAGIDGKALAKSLVENPEQFGPLRGKVGLLGESKERKLARHYSHALGNHIGFAAETWQRRLEAERKSETWKRERQDIVDVPGLTPRSQALLQQFDSLALEDRPTFLAQLSATPEGKQAITEAQTIASALEQRFGSADPRNLKPDPLRLGPETANTLDHIKRVARIVERVQRAELTQKHELKQSLREGLRLGW